MSKFIFVTGGVLSSIGKGITSASLGALLETWNLKINLIKMDPYLNVDAGTMNPYQHGEVFVTEDGGETDLDLGHYERFTHTMMKKQNNITSGQVYLSVIEKERKGEYLGATVQVIPHITDEIKRRIYASSRDFDVTIVEVGGTVGDIEGLPFLEAIRQIALEQGRDNVCFVHVSYIPYVKTAGELKTKPTQHSVKELRAIGIYPDFIIARSEVEIPEDVKKKISLFCNVEKEHVISAPDLKTIYEVPLYFKTQGLDKKIIKRLFPNKNIEENKLLINRWKNFVHKLKNLKKDIYIAIVGKYVKLADAYKSICEALSHAGVENDVKVNILWVSSDELEKDKVCIYNPPLKFLEILKNNKISFEKENEKVLIKDVDKFFNLVDAILVPGGFGDRGVEGKIKAVKIAREKKIPFLGICLGMQCAAIEFARNVANLKDAHSKEFDSQTPYPIIDLMEEQKRISALGGTMRLGAYPCKLKKGTLAYEIYKECFENKELKEIFNAKKDIIFERHRHRYEFNSAYKETLEKFGLIFSGICPDNELVEIIELPSKIHPFFIGVQFHPEFKSRPLAPHPLFKAFVKAAKEKKENNISS